jgi:hypothetical protein
LNKNRLAEVLSPQGRAEVRRGIEQLKAELRQLLRDRDLTGMTDDMVDAVKSTGTVISAFYQVMFEVEAEARLYMGADVDHALRDTVAALMDRGSEILAEQISKKDHYRALKEQLQRNKHG